MHEIIRDLYASCGALRPKAFKPEGGTALLSDLFFIGHYLELVELFVGEIAQTETMGLAVEGKNPRSLLADIIIKCVGFHPNTTGETVLHTKSMSGVGLVDLNLWVKGEPHVDNGPDTSRYLAPTPSSPIPMPSPLIPTPSPPIPTPSQSFGTQHLLQHAFLLQGSPALLASPDPDGKDCVRYPSRQHQSFHLE